VPQRSEPAVAPPSTGIEPKFWELDSDAATVACLGAMLVAMLEETYSGDTMAMASRRAARMASQFGVTAERFEKVRGVVMSKWAEIARGSVMHRVFGTGDLP